MILGRRVWIDVKIPAGEGRLVFLLLAQSFLMGIAFTFVQTAAFSLFLTEFGVEMLPWVFILAAVLLVALFLAPLGLAAGLANPGRLSLSLGTTLVITILFALGSTVLNSGWLIFVLPALFQIVIQAGRLMIRSLAEVVFDSRQGRHLVGLTETGQWLAMGLTGFWMPGLVAWLPVSSLLWLGALAMGGALLVTRAILRWRDDPSSDESIPEQRNEQDVNSIGILLSNPETRLIVGLTLAGWLAFALLDNIFFGQAAAAHPDGVELAGFIGIILGWLGMFTFVSKLFFSSWLLNYYGVRAGLLLLPVSLVLGSLGMVTLGSFPAALVWAAGFTKILCTAVAFSVDETALGILYQPFPANLRAQQQALQAAPGMLQALAFGLAGTLVLGTNALFQPNPVALAFVLFVVVAGMAVAAGVAGRKYILRFEQAVAGRQLNGDEFLAGDAESTFILEQGLASTDAGMVIYSARMLEAAQVAVLEASLPELLTHPAPEVRWAALEWVRRLRLASALPLIKAQTLIPDSDLAEVRGAALRCLGEMGDDGVMIWLDDPAQTARAGALLGLLAGGSKIGKAAASEKLNELIESPAAAERVLAAQILGYENSSNIGRQESSIRALKLLIGDPDVQVRRAALRSVERFHSDEIWPDVIAALACPATRSAAAMALIAGDRQAVPWVRSVFVKAETGRGVMLQLIRLCGKIGDNQSIGLLKNHIEIADVELRSAALRALIQCGYQVTDWERAQFQTLFKNEVGHSAWLTASVVEVGFGVGTALLQSALAVQLRNSLERILILLSFLEDGPVVLRAQDDLFHGSALKRANAINAIEVQTPPLLRDCLLALLDDLSPDQRSKRLSAVFPLAKSGRWGRLSELALNSGRQLDAWTQACALYTLGLLVPRMIPELLQALSCSPDELVRETAARLGHLSGIGVEGARAMLSTIERVLILKTVSIFVEMPEEILVDIARALSESPVLSGETIFEKGAMGDSMYVIASGRLRAHDRERTIHDLVSGDALGELAMFDPEMRSASVTAMEDSLLLCMDRHSLYALIDERPDVARSLLQSLAQHLRTRLLQPRAERTY